MAMRKEVRFLLGGDEINLSDIDPNTTLLNYLRGIGRCGTKEGCAEGDCGACSVVLVEENQGALDYKAVNACIQLIPVVDGKQVLTVEDLRGPDGSLHPVQAALVETNATQCGFCTPGFVMSLFALYRSGARPDRQELNDALAGNLCRCTGYGPIVDAGLQALDGSAADCFAKLEATMLERLASWRRDGTTLAYDFDGRRFLAPRNLAELAVLLAEEKNAVVVAGLTDVGLWITKQHRRFDTFIHVSEVAELREVRKDDDSIFIGAAVPYAEAFDTLAEEWPDLGELIRRLGSLQIRNAGTIGGNIANGSPIGDMSPPLIALNARLYLGSASGTREMPLENFFLDYGRQDLRPGEFVAGVRVPRLETGQHFGCYKLSKRFDQDISSVCGAFRIVLADDGMVTDARLAFGGMAGVPKRAKAAEGAFENQPWNRDTVQRAMTALGTDFTPLSDHRASAAYRLLGAQNLLYRFYLETSECGVETRLPGMRGAGHG